MKKDKILVWLSADFTHYSIIYFLQKTYDCEIYAIVDITNKPKNFFLNQKLINFKKIWFYHDNIHPMDHTPDLAYLQNMEERYDLKFWQLAINERIFYRFFHFFNFSDQIILSILQQSCMLFEKIINEVKPDFFLSPTPYLHHHEMFYRMIRYEGIKCLILSIPKIASKCLISEDVNQIDYFDGLQNVTPKGFDLTYLKEYMVKKSPNKQISQYWDNMGKRKSLRLKSLLHYIFTANTNYKSNYAYYGKTKLKTLLNLINLNIKKRIRENFINKNLKNTLETNQPYVYFPLSVDMERNLLIDAPFYTNQIEIIRSVAKSLPVNYKLYLKENPAQKSREWRSLSEYRQILEIPNVVFHHHSLSSRQLIENSSLVVTIAGSSGLEALFYGKPSLIFTDLIYSFIPSITKVERIDKLDTLIRQAINSKVNYEEVDKFIQVFENNTIEFDLYDFINKFDREFYYEGSLFDVEINEDRLEKFLILCKPMLDVLVMAHIDKINQHKKNLNGNT